MDETSREAAPSGQCLVAGRLDLAFTADA
jgi:hypothetical protein